MARPGSSGPTLLALGIGLVCLALLPFIPILPGLGSLVALILGLLARPSRPRWSWTTAAVVVSSAGLLLALIQLAAALLSALGVGSGQAGLR